MLEMIPRKSLGAMAIAPWLFFLLTLPVGCQSMMMQRTPGANAPAQDMVSVQVRPAYGKPKNTQVMLKENMRLQDVLGSVRTGFMNKQAYIVRTSPLTGEKHKLEAQMGSDRRISLQTDYAIQPGDRVVISQDATSSFDRVMKTFLGQS